MYVRLPVRVFVFPSPSYARWRRVWGEISWESRFWNCQKQNSLVFEKSVIFEQNINLRWAPGTLENFGLRGYAGMAPDFCRIFDLVEVLVVVWYWKHSQNNSVSVIHSQRQVHHPVSKSILCKSYWNSFRRSSQSRGEATFQCSKWDAFDTSFWRIN